MENEDLNKPTPDQHERYVDQRTRDKIREHISDPNSRITKQDIENVNTEIYKHDEDITSLEDEIAPKAPNPWDIKQ